MDVILRRLGEAAPEPLPAHFAPLGWQLTSLAGDHLREADAGGRLDEFRAPRPMPAAQLTAA